MSPLLREVVQSSSVRSLGYERTKQALEIEFHGGRVYRYLRVPPEIWSAFKRAPSKGQFFKNFIRDHFETTRVP